MNDLSGLLPALHTRRGNSIHSFTLLNTMLTPTMVEGVFLTAGLVIAFVRWRRRRRVTRRDGRRPPENNLPESASLAGVPLHILWSDRSGPGGLLRDTLITGPSSRNF